MIRRLATTDLFPNARAGLLLIAALIAFVGGCARMPDIGIMPLKFSGFDELRRYVSTHPQDIAQFQMRGPFEVTIRQDHDLQISASERIAADVYVSMHGGKAPLVIMLHGYENSKADHAYQAVHLASWGLHSMVLQLPNKGPWIGHGRTLSRVVGLIRKHPEDIFGRLDTDHVILVGHSFGATAVAHALASGAPVAGAILLDPASIGRTLPTVLGRIRKPVMVIGADDEVFPARGREHFFQYIPANVAEVSIRNADHQDAQFRLGLDGSDGEQMTFVGALTASAFSLGTTDRFDQAWNSFDKYLSNGKLFDPKRK